MLHVFTLPAHLLEPINKAVRELQMDGNSIILNKLEVDKKIQSHNQLVMDVECHPYDLFRIGLKAGANLK